MHTPVNNKPVVCLMGTTATGKTDIAVKLVKEFPIEIISVDSAMIYRGMDIGTAKPDSATLQQAPHHLIDIIEPSESYSAATFRQDALQLIEQVHQRDNIPLLVGGTLLYFRALLSGLTELPSADPDLRKTIEDEAASSGWAGMHDELKRIDPETAAKVHPNDPQRIQRAIEVYRLTGTALSVLQQHENKQLFPYPVIKFGLAASDRSWLHERIADRFSMMLEQGLVAEVEQLFQRVDMHLDLPSMRCVGYRQVWQYLLGDISFEAMQEKAVIATRQLAKRQHTWLRSEADLTVFDPNLESQTDIISTLKSAIKNMNVL